MNYEEAILELQHQTEMLPKEPPEDYNGNIEVWFKDYNTIITSRIKAIEALEKQIPKKPINIIEKRINGRRTYMCPSCKNVLVDIDEQGVQWGHESIHCECCGQALDWSEMGHQH